MKIGMNDPCPCGSGKKYKKCCRDKEYDINNIKKRLDELYSIIKGYNDELLEKANEPNYTNANFHDATHLAITSNALSLVKGLFQNNHYSITNALNMRNVIECLVLLIMDEKGDVSDTQKELFVEQYKIIEYESYHGKDSEKYKCLLNISDLKKRYEEGKAKFLSAIGSENKFKRIKSSRLPFMCNEKLNYNMLIEKYCPDLLETYGYLSRIIHPSSYQEFRNEELYNHIFGNVMTIIFRLYENVAVSKKGLNYTDEQKLIYWFGRPIKDNFAQRLYDLQKEQWQILKNIAKKFDDVLGTPNYVGDFLREVTLVIHDVNTDSQLGYTENVKLKFKVIAEMFACFDKTYFSLTKNEDRGYYYEMLYMHDVIKERELAGIAVSEEDKQMIYDRYKSCFPASKLTAAEVFDKFDRALGFLVDNEGKVPSYNQLVCEYFESVFDDANMTNADIKIRDFYKLVYKESNNMSHGCGYLFFSNTGAWMDDFAVIQFLDGVILHLLKKLGIVFMLYSAFDDKNKIISDCIKEHFQQMQSSCEEKAEILLKVKRIPKSF